MKLLLEDLRRLPRLMLGLSTLGIGIFLTKISLLGLAPWGVFHDGLALLTGIDFGFITQIVGAVVLVLSLVLFRTKIGFGTVINVLYVGPLIVLLGQWFPNPLDALWLQILAFTLGFLLMTFGRSLYISSELGQGPRDGLFVGIARTTSFQVRHVKPAIELTVMVIGWALGGQFFIGTILIILFSGYFVQWFFQWLKYDPKQSVQNSFFDYFREKKESSV